MMTSEESIEIRQNNELEVLQSIYGDDLKDLRRSNKAWKNWAPLDLVITLTPQQGSSGNQEVYVKIDLHIICDQKYPISPPRILLENAKGLSDAIKVELQEKLVAKSNELKSEEMIFQLCQIVEEFLPKYNKPASKSFYDEMLKRQKEKEEFVLLQENRQKLHMLEEVHRRQEILKSESRIRREHRYNSENSNEDDVELNRRISFTNRKHNNSSTESSDEPILCDHKGSALITFGCREIQRGRCIKHIIPNYVVYIGVDLKSGEIVIIYEWRIEFESHITKQVASIEQELNYLTKLKHSHLAHYQSMKYETVDNAVVVHLIKEYINGTNCCAFIRNPNFNIDLDFLKHIAKGILTALDYLHRNNVVHKEIKNSNVYIDNHGDLKVSNYSIHRRLNDLINPKLQNYGKKTDIYSFGILLLKLLKSEGRNHDIAEIPSSVSDDLYDFLTKCVSKEEKDRCTTTQLLQHSFFHKLIVPNSPKHKVGEIDIPRNISPEVAHNDLLILSQSQPNGQSRINNEFEFLQHLGKGAFGDVIKVKNKLDGGYYAIKRIKLNPKNKQLSKKIVREVKLLSRLNHENVVRYYNSWIETTTIKEKDFESSGAAAYGPKVVRKDQFSVNDNIEAMAPPIKNVEVSITYDSKSQAAFALSDEDSSDDDSGWGLNSSSDSESDGIEFQEDEIDGVKANSASNSSDQDYSGKNVGENVKRIDFMYIQMEFCEKSTLRIAIDNKLYLDEDRLWRLFREIVEGLAHIHQQGMIHRDLKPVNIFLDYEDHVKIGDFGLATNINSRQNEIGTKPSAIESEKEDTVDESKTGLVGTALYVAPEISATTKSIYNQKVDIYSLGIILFEMCYKPLETSMERIKILLGIRSKEMLLPQEFTEKNNYRQEFLIRWLLNHDISKRPTSQELLQSEHIPPPVLEECELRELVRHTLSNPQLKGYKYLIASCFQQSLSPAQDITYDKDPTAPVNAKPLQLYDFVKQITLKVFKLHGGQNLTTPLLMPKGRQFEGIECSVKLMTHFGSIVTLPHDLRVPFARYIAWNGITMLRRYAVERVYREKKVFGFMPRELYECAFDIVSPTSGSNFLPDAEILYIVYEIINEIPSIKNKHFLIRLNHVLLLKAILIHCGIKDKHEEMFKIISDTKVAKESKYEMQNYLITLGLSDNNINLLLNFFNAEYEISKVTNYFQVILKKKTSEASQLAKQALKELQLIAQNAEAFGVTFDIVVAPSLVYNIQQYSGVICQFVCELKRKHKHSNMEVLAAGGRYDSLIGSYRNIIQQATMSTRDIKQSAVGISISLDKLVQAIQKEDVPKSENNFDVIFCSVGTKPLLKEKAQILKSLWSAGIKYFFMEAMTMEEIDEQVNELKIAHVIMLIDNEQGTVRVRSWNKDRFQEDKHQISFLVNHIPKILNLRQKSEEPVARSESKTFHCERFESHEANVDVIFFEKYSPNTRRRWETKIRSQLSTLFNKLTGHVVVPCISIDSSVVNSLTTYLDFESEYQFHKSVEQVIEKHPKHKKMLNDICDRIYDIKNQRTSPIIILYSLSETTYKLLSI